MAKNDLVIYIEAARAKQISDDTIKLQQLKSGWKESEILEAMQPVKDIDPSLLPPPAPHVDMWVSFQYILLFIALYISATAFGGILSHSVNKLIPDALEDVSFYGSESGKGIKKGYLAALTVAYPIFALLFIRLRKLTYGKTFYEKLKIKKIAYLYNFDYYIYHYADLCYRYNLFFT